ncbi:CHAP domain-containing protein [Sinosporangium album]|uniref:CHAP domain-containing protein n=1 Tax=Sinosporangium album TaxID=504805 RepID=A0A1G7UY65_9ACTN|nr:CHAP domain-containing protein [Sinosporangium album]SDG52493.1 CHAP domain-containing protein [Sinosporangium album]
MDPIVERLLDVVRPELGYQEKAGQFTKYGEWYAETIDIHPKYRNAPWCDMFIAWAAEQAGLAEVVGQFAWTPSHAVWFQQQAAWSDSPEPGAVVFYDWAGGDAIKGIDHVGLVEKVRDGKIHTIEANVDGVWLKRKVRDESKVVGYGLPRKVQEHLDELAATQITLRGNADTMPGYMEELGVGAVTVAAPSPNIGVPITPQTAAYASGTLALLLALILLVRQLRGPRRPLVGRHRRRGRGAQEAAREPAREPATVGGGPA